ncbi:ankrd52 [Symbiodinium sp. CCMP2592]|nr:ankrd52 [Symbiodinium sp. CCMP2592]
MEPGDDTSPPGLSAASADVGMDLDILRGLPAAQPELIQRSGNQALSDRPDEIEDKLTAQRVVIQQFTDRCCMLQDRLQHLEDAHNGAGSAPTMVVDEDQKGKTRRGRGRRRTVVAVPCNEVSSTLQPPVKTHIAADEEGDTAQVGIGADGRDTDLEPDERDRSWRTTEPADMVDACPSSFEGIGSWKDTSWYAPGKARKRGVTRARGTQVQGGGVDEAGAWMAQLQQARDLKQRGMALCRLWLQMVQSDWAKGYRERRFRGEKLPTHLPEDLSRRLDLAHEELARERLRSEELTAELSKARQVADDEVQSLRRQLLSREKELFEAAAARQRSASQTEALAEALRGKLLELEARLATPSQPSTPLYGGRDLLDGWRSSAKRLEDFGVVREEVPRHRWSEHAPNGYPRSGLGFLEGRGSATSARAEDLEAKAPLGMQGLSLSAPIAALDEEDWPPNPYRWPDQAGREERPLEAGEEPARDQCDPGSEAAPATASEEGSLDPSAQLAPEDPSRVDGHAAPAQSHYRTKRTLETGLAPPSIIP